jgi:hypothetical protein
MKPICCEKLRGKLSLGGAGFALVVVFFVCLGAFLTNLSGCKYQMYAGTYRGREGWKKWVFCSFGTGGKIIFGF